MSIPKESKYIHLEYTAFKVKRTLSSLVAHFPYTRAQILLQLLNREIDKQELILFVKKLHKNNVSMKLFEDFMLKACEKPQHILEVNRLLANITKVHERTTQCVKPTTTSSSATETSSIASINRPVSTPY